MVPENFAILGWISAAMLFAAAAAWAKLGRGPILRTLNSRAKLKTQQVENASRLLVVAVGVGALVAVIAIGDRMFG